MEKLTGRQTEVLHFVEDYQGEHGRAPTLQEICDYFGFQSLASAQQHLRLIERKGFLTRKPHSSRSIRVVKQESPIGTAQIIAVPLVGKIAAGSPTFALEEVEEVLPLPKRLFSGRSLFALRVHGDSMVNAGIFDTDIAILRSQPDFADGDIAAVIVDEEATLKRVFQSPKGLRLHAENEAYPDRVIPPGELSRSCRVAGVLVGTIRKFD
jgi:repressor LexA